MTTGFCNDNIFFFEFVSLDSDLSSIHEVD